MKDLEARYGASAIPIREALIRLASTGFINSEDLRGFRVAEVSVADLLDITYARQEIESAVLREAIRIGDVDWEARLVAAHHRMSHLIESSDPTYEADPQMEDSHMRFHLELLSGCGSRWLLRAAEDLMVQSMRYQFVAWNTERSTKEEHDKILRATLDKNSDLAVRLLREHYEITAGYVTEALERSQTSPSPNDDADT